jgi:hypothetical protein
MMDKEKKQSQKVVEKTTDNTLSTDRGLQDYLQEIAKRVGKPVPQPRNSTSKSPEEKETSNEHTASWQRIKKVGIAVLIGLSLTTPGNSEELKDYNPGAGAAKGIAITEGKPTKEILAIAKIYEKPEGISYKFTSPEFKKAPLYDGFSIQLNVFAHLGKETELVEDPNLLSDAAMNKPLNKVQENSDVSLWLQNIKHFIHEGGDNWKHFIHEGGDNWKVMDGADIYKLKYSETPIQTMRGNTHMDIMPIPALQISMTSQDRHVTNTSPVLTFIYNGLKEDINFPIEMAFDIKIENINPNTIKVYFNNIPVKTDGTLEWKKETVFDAITYTGNFHNNDVNISFGNEHHAALVVAGFGNAQDFTANKFNAELSMYEVSPDKKLEKLKLGGFEDPMTAEGIANVKVVQVSPNTVKVTANDELTQKP